MRTTYLLHRNTLRSGQIDFDELERQWEDGDDEEDLKTESQLEFERLERRRKLESASAGSLDPR